MSDSECVFCEILKQHGDRVLHEYKHVFVMFSDPRLVPGHLLVIPKRHVEKLSELPASEKTELFTIVEMYEEKILKNIAPGCDIRSNYRPFMPQSRLKVNHLHIHLLPRQLEDELYQRSMKFEKEIFAPTTNEELERYRKALDREQ
jgi:histidine triad (HIT) family protein